jgi:hypothetical protein
MLIGALNKLFELVELIGILHRKYVLYLRLVELLLLLGILLIREIGLGFSHRLVGGDDEL